MADNGVIGANNQLPWRLPDDLRRFKAITLGKPIIMGRKTFQSIGKPLPGRHNIVVTRGNMHVEGCSVVNSIAAALQSAGNSDEVIVIGGAEIYQQALPLAHRIYLTQVHADISGDAGFPALNLDEWREISREAHAADENHMYAFSFITLERLAL